MVVDRLTLHPVSFQDRKSQITFAPTKAKVHAIAPTISTMRLPSSQAIASTPRRKKSPKRDASQGNQNIIIYSLQDENADLLRKIHHLEMVLRDNGFDKDGKQIISFSKKNSCDVMVDGKFLEMMSMMGMDPEKPTVLTRYMEFKVLELQEELEASEIEKDRLLEKIQELEEGRSDHAVPIPEAKSKESKDAIIHRNDEGRRRLVFGGEATTDEEETEGFTDEEHEIEDDEAAGSTPATTSSDDNGREERDEDAHELKTKNEQLKEWMAKVIEESRVRENDFQDKISDLEASISTFRHREADLERQIQELESSQMEAMNFSGYSMEEHQRQQEELEECKSRNEKMEDWLWKVVEESKAREGNMKETIENLEAEIEESNSKESLLYQQVQELEAKVEQLENTCTKSKEMESVLEGALEKEINEHQRLIQKLVDMQSKAKITKQKNHDKQVEMEKRILELEESLQKAYDSEDSQESVSDDESEAEESDSAENSSDDSEGSRSASSNGEESDEENFASEEENEMDQAVRKNSNEKERLAAQILELETKLESERRVHNELNQSVTRFKALKSSKQDLQEELESSYVEREWLEEKVHNLQTLLDKKSETEDDESELSGAHSSESEAVDGKTTNQRILEMQNKLEKASEENKRKKERLNAREDSFEKKDNALKTGRRSSNTPLQASVDHESIMKSTMAAEQDHLHKYINELKSELDRTKKEASSRIKMLEIELESEQNEKLRLRGFMDNEGDGNTLEDREIAIEQIKLCNVLLKQESEANIGEQLRLEKVIAALRRDIRVSTDENENAQGDLRVQIAELENELEVQKDEHNRLQKIIDDLQDKLDTATSRHKNELENASENNFRNHQKLLDRIHELENEVEAEARKYNQFKNAIGNAQSGNTIDSSVNEQQSESNVLRIQELESELEELKETILDLDKELQGLFNQIEDEGADQLKRRVGIRFMPIKGPSRVEELERELESSKLENASLLCKLKSFEVKRMEHLNMSQLTEFEEDVQFVLEEENDSDFTEQNFDRESMRRQNLNPLSMSRHSHAVTINTNVTIHDEDSMTLGYENSLKNLNASPTTEGGEDPGDMYMRARAFSRSPTLDMSSDPIGGTLEYSTYSPTYSPSKSSRKSQEDLGTIYRKASRSRLQDDGTSTESSIAGEMDPELSNPTNVTGRNNELNEYLQPLVDRAEENLGRKIPENVVQGVSNALLERFNDGSCDIEWEDFESVLEEACQGHDEDTWFEIQEAFFCVWEAED